MAATPKVYGPDGVLRETTVYSTTIPNQFYQGVIAEDTVDMEISIRGGPFTSDPDFIQFEGTSFQIPNPQAFTDGFELAAGENVILIRSISFSGAVSANARLVVQLFQDSDLGLIPTVPSNISVERFDQSVTIWVEGNSDANFRGINFYASQFTGGGATGYQRININVVADKYPEYDTLTISSFETNNELATNPDGSIAADPLYIQIQETQTKGGDVIERLEDVTLTPQLAASITYNEQANLLKTDYVRQIEVPEGTRSIRSTYLLESLVERVYYNFSHNRKAGQNSVPATVPIGAFASLPVSENLFYVARAVYYDADRQTEVESPNSVEVVASPVAVTQNIGSFPTVSQLQIQQNTISDIQRTRPEIALQPGAVIRDVFVDPFSQEAVRIRFLVDFMHRMQSFDTLLAVDGVDAASNPTPVTQSAYKTALQAAFQLSRPEDVQFIFNQAFDQLAARNGVSRIPGKKARGIATFFTRSKPTRTLTIQLGTQVGSGSTIFLTTQTVQIPVENSAAFYNPSTRLYSIDVIIEAQSPGVAGNVSRGQINSILSNVPGLSVTNQNRTFGGEAVETNLALATRARGVLSAVDSGTEQGIRQRAAAQPGVEEVIVVEAGDPLMQRDWDPTHSVHVGGKADVWIRGTVAAQVTDTFAFVFREAFDVQFRLTGNPLLLIFRSLDPSLTVENPLSEMLNYPSLGLGFRNASSGATFNLTNYKILDYRTIQLDASVGQPSVTFGDVVFGDYRYTISRDFVLPRQPVGQILSVVGQVSGELPDESVVLYRVSDPLDLGRSAQAGSFIRITPVDGVPAGTLIPVTQESHTIIGEFNETLDNLGVSTLTIQVYNSTRTILYRGPTDPSGVSDYTIIPGTQTSATAIRRIPGGNITSGQVLSIDYSYNENFVVTYTTNLVLATTQNALQQTKGVTYDILCKEAVATRVDILATIIKSTGIQTNQIQRAVRTNLDAFLRGLPIGASVRQSDVIGIIEATGGVSYVEVPLTKMARGAGTVLIREPLTTTQKGDSTYLPGTASQPFSSTTVNVWLLEDELDAATSIGGGPVNEFRGVFQDEQEMVLQIADPMSLKNAPGKAYIIGNEGLSIPGFSDDLTLEQQFPTATTTEIQTQRRTMTQNRILVSLGIDDRPSVHNYTVTYLVSPANSGVRNIEGDALEYFLLGDLVLTVAEEG